LHKLWRALVKKASRYIGKTDKTCCPELSLYQTVYEFIRKLEYTRIINRVIHSIRGGDVWLEESDIEIINGIISGNQALFSVLVTRYKRLIYSVVYNMIPDKQDVNDISQEVFIRIFQSLNRYNPEYKFSTWAVRITTNYCLDILRKKKVDSISIDETQEVLRTMDTPETKYMKKEKTLKIRNAINELPEKYRTPIILYHQNGLSYEEISHILNEPMSIIKNRLYRARLMLRDKLSMAREEEIL
jgi:RNA polymerase sigma-70 factor (ECF subfamily)